MGEATPAHRPDHYLLPVPMDLADQDLASCFQVARRLQAECVVSALELDALDIAKQHPHRLHFVHVRHILGAHPCSGGLAGCMQHYKHCWQSRDRHDKNHVLGLLAVQTPLHSRGVWDAVVCAWSGAI